MGNELEPSHEPEVWVERVCRSWGGPATDCGTRMKSFHGGDMARGDGHGTDTHCKTNHLITTSMRVCICGALCLWKYRFGVGSVYRTESKGEKS